MSFEERISYSFAKSEKLQDELSQTEWAFMKLPETQKLITSKQEEIKVTKKELERLGARTKQELKEHESYQHSHFRKGFSKFTGRQEKFHAREDKEAHDYTEALEAEQRAKDHLATLQTELQDAEAQRTDQEPTSRRHQDLQSELDNLYNSIFDGPTLGFPNEDHKEDLRRDAQREHDHAVQILEAEAKASTLLQEAKGHLDRAVSQMERAKSDADADVFWGGAAGDMISMDKRQLLQQARDTTSRVPPLIAEAKRYAPEIEQMGELKIVQAGLMSDVIFDNVFTDMSMDSKVYDSYKDVKHANWQLGEQIKLVEERKSAKEAQMQEAAGRLNVARKELQNVRHDIFRQVAQGGGQTAMQENSQQYASQDSQQYRQDSQNWQQNSQGYPQESQHYPQHYSQPIEQGNRQQYVSQYPPAYGY